MIEWLRGLWTFYLAYTKTAVHAAAAAGFAIFGLLVFVDDAFAVLAIALYVLPPVILYVRSDGILEVSGSDETSSETANGRNDRRPERTTVVADGRAAHSTATGSRRSGGGDTDSDDDGDTDSDSDDGDTDSDSDDGDTDSDSDDGDTDSDSDDGDTDSDSDN